MSDRKLLNSSVYTFTSSKSIDIDFIIYLHLSKK